KTLLKTYQQGWDAAGESESRLRALQTGDLQVGWRNKMRIAAVCAIAISISLATSAAWAQNNAANALGATAGIVAPAATRGVCPDNPDPLSIARIVEIDTTGGPVSDSSTSRRMIFCERGK